MRIETIEQTQLRKDFWAIASTPRRDKSTQVFVSDAKVTQPVLTLPIVLEQKLLNFSTERLEKVFHKIRWQYDYMKIKEDIRGILDYACSADWDGEGAAQVEYETVDNALKLLDQIPAKLYPFDVSPDPDGSIGFSWFHSGDVDFSVMVYPGEKVIYAGYVDGQKIIDSYPLSDAIPHRLKNIFERLSK